GGRGHRYAPCAGVGAPLNLRIASASEVAKRNRRQKRDTGRSAMTSQRSRLFVLGLAAFCLAATGDARALDYPTRPVHWIVPYPPGGSTDILARIIGGYLSEHMGQQFVIENRPGGGNNIGTEAVAHAAPDGYTLILVNPAHGINATLYPKLNFNF